LHTLGFGSVQDVRAGKYIEIRIDEKDMEKARSKTQDMCKKLLANPVIENFRFEIEKVRE
jgi:phosphoribosylformylglycinamidine synthase